MDENLYVSTAYSQAFESNPQLSFNVDIESVELDANKICVKLKNSNLTYTFDVEMVKKFIEIVEKSE